MLRNRTRVPHIGFQRPGSGFERFIAEYTGDDQRLADAVIAVRLLGNDLVSPENQWLAAQFALIRDPDVRVAAEDYLKRLERHEKGEKSPNTTVRMANSQSCLKDARTNSLAVIRAVTAEPGSFFVHSTLVHSGTEHPTALDRSTHVAPFGVVR